MRSVAFIIAMLLVTGCRNPRKVPDPGEVSDEGAFVEKTREGIMGTRVQVKVWTSGSEEEKQRALEGIDAAIAAALEVEKRMSPWDPQSAVSRVNASAGKKPVKVDDWTWQVLETSLKVSESTSGAFDPTWAALSGLWDHRAADPVVPSADQIAARLPLVDYRDVQLDPADRTVKLAREGMRIGLGGSAKGFALDRMAAALVEAGAESFICYAGGDLFVNGRPGARPWKLGIQHPREPSGLIATYEVEGPRAVVTSGDYERFFTVDGVRYHHILDPTTGFPATGSMSVTLLASTGLLADALSTGVFVLGPSKGLKLVQATDGVEVAIIDADGRFHVSGGLKGDLEILGDI